MYDVCTFTKPWKNTNYLKTQRCEPSWKVAVGRVIAYTKSVVIACIAFTTTILRVLASRVTTITTVSSSTNVWCIVGGASARASSVVWMQKRKRVWVPKRYAWSPCSIRLPHTKNTKWIKCLHWKIAWKLYGIQADIIAERLKNWDQGHQLWWPWYGLKK